MPATVLADLALARRLEATEGRGNAAFVEAQAATDPNSGAIWKSIGGTLAMFAGVGSPITQTFGLGVHQPLTAADLDAIERFFETRGSRVFHEVCPLAGVEVPAMLAARGYTPIEMSSVLYREIDGAPAAAAANPDLRVRSVEKSEGAFYARMASRGWAESPEVQPFIERFAHISVQRAACFVAELNGTPIATAAVFMHEGVALLAGASTIPDGRRQGAQSALLDTRLRAATSKGCDLAMMCAAPGSSSQRNAERNGFRIAYTRTKWQK
jgi:GNAT superfamily N-acetyltransferase